MKTIRQLFETPLQIMIVLVMIVACIVLGLSIMVGVMLEQLDGTCSVIHEFTCSDQHRLTISKCWFDDGFYAVYDAYRNEESIVKSAYVALGSYPESLELSMVASRESPLVAIVTKDEPYDPVIIQDFRSGESWAERGEGTREVLQKRLAATYPRLSVTTQLQDHAYLQSRWSLDVSQKPVNGRDLLLLLPYTNIRHLNLSNTGLSDSDMAYVGQLAFLEELRLSSNAVTNTGLASLHTMTNLDTLHLDETAITEEGLAFLGKMKALIELKLPTTMTLSDTGLQFLGQLTSLRELTLANASITDEGLQYLLPLKNMYSLDLRGTGISDKGLQYVGKFAHLERLSVDECWNISDKGLKYLTNLNLSHLFLSKIQISDDAISTIQQFPHIEYVNLRDTNVTETREEQLRKAVRRIRISR